MGKRTDYEPTTDWLFWMPGAREPSTVRIPKTTGMYSLDERAARLATRNTLGLERLPRKCRFRPANGTRNDYKDSSNG